MTIDARPLLLLLVLLVAAGGTLRGADQVIDFDDLTYPNNQTWDTTSGPLVTKGFSFAGVHFHTMTIFSVSGGTAWNGSPCFLANDGGSFGSALTVGRTDGQPFSFNAVDAAEVWVNLPSYPNATAIQIVGRYSDNSTKTLTFPLDGINDGMAGGANDFETLSFPGQFVGIVSATLDGLGPSGATGFAWAFDDFDVSDGCAVVYGAGCAGSGGFEPELRATACDLATGPVTIEIAKGLGGSTAVFFIGLSTAQVPIGSSGCSILVAPLLVVPFAFPLGGSGPGAGVLVINATLPIVDLTGSSFTMQAAVGDAAAASGFTTTNGLEFKIP